MVNRQWLVFASLILCAAVAKADLNWNGALSGEHRSEKNHARDVYRHPQETLSFFGIAPGMTVMEISPGGGWYTEVLAPLMKDNGSLIAAHSSVNGGNYARRSLGGFLKKLGRKRRRLRVSGDCDIATAECGGTCGSRFCRPGAGVSQRTLLAARGSS